MLEWVNQELEKASTAFKMLNDVNVPATLPPQFEQDVNYVTKQTGEAVKKLIEMKAKLEKRITMLQEEVVRTGQGQARVEHGRSVGVDLELKNIGQYYGSETLYQSRWGRYTEGVKYVMDNGYAWFVNDALIAINSKPSLHGQPFLVIWLKLKEGPTAYMVIDDGNGHILYTQDYVMTDAKVPVKLYYENRVMMLPGER